MFGTAYTIDKDLKTAISALTMFGTMYTIDKGLKTAISALARFETVFTIDKGIKTATDQRTGKIWDCVHDRQKP